MWKVLWLSSLVIKAVNLSDISYYEVLGVSKEATVQEIRQTYKRLAVKLHPDKNPDKPDHEKFMKITEAYEILKDPEKRRKYDLYGSTDFTGYGHHNSRSQTEYNKMFYNGLYHEDEYVDTLSGKTFQTYIMEGLHFVNFYSPFCPPCQSLSEHWKKLARVYKGIMKVGAVNCKYHNSFCYNTMEIGSYPSLLFYPYGKDANYVYYRGDRTFKSLEQFVLQYLRSLAPVGVARRRASGTALYVRARGGMSEESLLRISYRLKDLMPVLRVEDTSLLTELSLDGATAAVVQHGGRDVRVRSEDEDELVREAVDALPSAEDIDPNKFKSIRASLRNGSHKPWLLYFTRRGQSTLPLHKVKAAYPQFHFGSVDCSAWAQLCSSLGAEAACWAALKPGGVYQAWPPEGHVAQLVQAALLGNLHSVSATEALRILDDSATWLLGVVPHGAAWQPLIDAFVRAATHFAGNNELQLGILRCSATTDSYCRRLSGAHPSARLVRAGHAHAHVGRMDADSVVNFVELLLDDPVVSLSDELLLEVLASGRAHSWAVAFLPAQCGPLCDQLAHHWRVLAKKLSPLPSVRVGVLDCARERVAFCANIRAPLARVYPHHSSQSYVSNLQQLSESIYMLEWALEYLHPPPARLVWHSFQQLVVTDRLTHHTGGGGKPWLVYFHSPRCRHCYEMYADFAITAILLNNALQVGKVNCLTESSLCQQEQIMSYPSIKLYLSGSADHAFSSIISVPVTDYSGIIDVIRPHLIKYNANSLDGIDKWGLEAQGFHMKRDEL